MIHTYRIRSNVFVLKSNILRTFTILINPHIEVVSYTLLKSSGVFNPKENISRILEIQINIKHSFTTNLNLYYSSSIE